MTRYRIRLSSKYANVTHTVEAPTDELAEKAAKILCVREDEYHRLYPTSAEVRRDWPAVKVEPDGSVHELTSLIDGTYRRIEED